MPYGIAIRFSASFRPTTLFTSQRRREGFPVTSAALRSCPTHSSCGGRLILGGSLLASVLGHAPTIASATASAPTTVKAVYLEGRIRNPKSISEQREGPHDAEAQAIGRGSVSRAVHQSKCG